MAFTFGNQTAQTAAMNLDHVHSAPEGYHPDFKADPPNPRVELNPEQARAAMSEEFAESLLWFSELNTGMASKVREMLLDPEGIFSVDLGNVSEFARKLAPQTALLGQLYAKLQKQEILDKSRIEVLEQEIRRQKALARRELKFGKPEVDGGKCLREQLPSKGSTEADFENEVLLDPRVQLAQTALQDFRITNWAELQELKYRVYTTIRSLDRLVSVIPGLQGTARDLGGSGAL